MAPAPGGGRDQTDPCDGPPSNGESRHAPNPAFPPYKARKIVKYSLTLHRLGTSRVRLIDIFNLGAPTLVQIAPYWPARQETPMVVLVKLQP